MYYPFMHFHLRNNTHRVGAANLEILAGPSRWELASTEHGLMSSILSGPDPPIVETVYRPGVHTGVVSTHNTNICSCSMHPCPRVGHFHFTHRLRFMNVISIDQMVSNSNIISSCPDQDRHLVTRPGTPKGRSKTRARLHVPGGSSTVDTASLNCNVLASLQYLIRNRRGH